MMRTSERQRRLRSVAIHGALGATPGGLVIIKRAYRFHADARLRVALHYSLGIRGYDTAGYGQQDTHGHQPATKHPKWTAT